MVALLILLVLRLHLKKVETRIFDDYRKAEGLRVECATLPDGIEIRDENYIIQNIIIWRN